MTPDELRSLIRAHGLTEALPRTYYYRDEAAELDEVMELLASYHHARERTKREAAAALEKAEEELEELQTRLREILREATLEDADADPKIDRTELLQQLRGALDADYRLDRERVMTHLREVPMRDQGGHRLHTFPLGVEWCDRCGLLIRPAPTKRFYLPGLGEVRALPPCAPIAQALPSPGPVGPDSPRGTP